MSADVVALRRVAVLNSRVLPESTDVDRKFKYVDISQVDGNGNVEIPEDFVSFAQAPSRARRLASAGDVVISTVRTYLRAIGRVPKTDGMLVFSTGFAVVESGPLMEARFLAYACRTEPFIAELEARSTGVSYPAINPSDLASIPVCVHPLDEQRRIADFLDDHVARIDALTERRGAQMRAVETLKWAQFEAAIQNFSDHGVRLGRVFRLVADGPFGSAFSSADYVDDGPAAIRLADIGLAEFRGTDLARVPNAIYDRFPRCHVNPGDLLVASLGEGVRHAGRACVAPEDLGPAMVKGKCFRAVVDPGLADAEFLALLLSSPLGARAFAVEGRGSTMQMINLGLLIDIVLPIPEVGLQRTLAASHAVQAERIAGALGSVARSIDLLNEYKRALITAAVTGDFDVTTARTGVPA